MDINLGFEGLSPQIDFPLGAEVLEAPAPIKRLSIRVLPFVMDID
jgi:hypothetical protein